MSNWERFNTRSENYDHYRPRYPSELLNLLKKVADLGPSSIVADIGSGTGLLAETILGSGCKLFCIEPNEEMRNLAIRKLGKKSNCLILDGRAENTSLPGNSIEIITAGQAFHWFEPKETKREFNRILKQRGRVVLVWNTRCKSSEGFNPEYERVVKQYSREYHSSGSEAVDLEVMKEFYNGKFDSYRIKNYQRLDLSGLFGRYFSSSYALSKTESTLESLKNGLTEAFNKNEIDGHVRIEYETEVFVGRVDK